MTPVFYNPQQAVTGQRLKSLTKTDEFARSASGGLVADFSPATRDELCLVHTPAYVDGVLGGTIQNGFGLIDQDINRSVLYSNGSFKAAARHALDSGKIVCSASQGFHHAKHAHGGGYCTFNGLVLAAMTECVKARVLIIDGDAHEGDGTNDCIEKLGLGNRVRNVTRGDEIGRPSQSGWRHRMWYWWALDLIDSHKPDIIFYQAGADAWRGDPYGCGYLTKGGLLRRDTGIFEASRSAGVPLVWNLAGGYSDETVALHLQTLAASDGVTVCLDR